MDIKNLNTFIHTAELNSFTKAAEKLGFSQSKMCIRDRAVEEPSKARSHIQKTAPAPPAEMAATTPTRFPIPTRVAVETMSACNPEILPL